MKERRRFIRARYPCRIIVHAPQKHIISTHTENISAGGIRVLIQEELKVSSIVGLEIYLREQPIACQGRVVWVVEKKSDYQRDFIFFDTGIEFYEIKDEDKHAINTFVESLFFGGR
ncbi:MAG: PilZ domain-containing protein [Candidatus Omnitrophota bacterium]|nr:MAG: PilZ domain-containing protein [Candidatus Omnitrophota bacterium]